MSYIGAGLDGTYKEKGVMALEEARGIIKTIINHNQFIIETSDDSSLVTEVIIAKQQNEALRTMLQELNKRQEIIEGVKQKCEEQTIRLDDNHVDVFSQKILEIIEEIKEDTRIGIPLKYFRNEVENE